MSLRVLVNRGHNISIRIEIRVMRACFDSWRETRLTEPVEKILFMEPICYVTRMLRIARHINADYECHLCFLGWKNRMHQRRMHSHIGRFVILRRLRAMVSRAFQTLRLFARRRIILMTLGFKVCESNHRSLQRSVFARIQELILMRKTLSTMGHKVATWCARSYMKQALSGWLAAVLSHTTYCQGRIGFIVAERTDRNRKIASIFAWKTIAQNHRRDYQRGHRALRRIGRRRLASSFQQWQSFVFRSRDLSCRERHLLRIFSVGSIRSWFQKWAAKYLYAKSIARMLCGFEAPGIKCMSNSMHVWKMFAARHRMLSRGKRRGLSRCCTKFQTRAFRLWLEKVQDEKRLVRAYKHIRCLLRGSLRLYFQGWMGLYVYTKRIARILMHIESMPHKLLVLSFREWGIYGARQSVLSRGKRRGLSRLSFRVYKLFMGLWLDVIHRKRQLMRANARIMLTIAFSCVHTWFQAWASETCQSKQIEHTRQLVVKKLVVNSKGTILNAWSNYALFRARLVITARRLFSSHILKNKRLVLSIWYEICIRKRRLIRNSSARSSFRTLRRNWQQWINFKMALLSHKRWAHSKIATCLLRFCRRHLQASFLTWSYEVCARRLRGHAENQIRHRSINKRYQLLFFGWDSCSVFDFWKSWCKSRQVLRLLIGRATDKRKIQALHINILAWADVSKISSYQRRACTRKSCGLVLRMTGHTMRACYAVWQGFTTVRRRQKSLDQRIQHKFQRERIAGPFSEWWRLTETKNNKSNLNNRAPSGSGVMRRFGTHPCLFWGMKAVGSLLDRRNLTVKKVGMGIWSDAIFANRKVERELRTLQVRRVHRILRLHFVALLELSQRLSSVRMCMVFGHLKSCDKMVAKQSFVTWSLAVATKQGTRSKHTHIMTRLRRRLNLALLQASWDAWLKAILCKYRGLEHAIHDWDLLSLLDEYGMSQYDAQSLRSALNQNKKLENAVCLLRDAKERTHVIMPAFHKWRRNIGTWMPRAALGQALVRKALVALSPNPPQLAVSSSAAFAITAMGLDDTSAFLSLQQFVHHSKDPAVLYAKVQTMKDVMDRWKWLVRWGRTKRLISWRFSSCKLDLCWKMWCLAVSRSHLLRQAALKIVSWTSVRGKGTYFRAWAITCRKVMHNQMKMAGSDDRRNRMMVQKTLWHWADLTLIKEEIKSNETAQDFANAILHLDARGECDVEIAVRLQSANDAVCEIDTQLERIYAKCAQQMEMAHVYQENSNTDIDTWLDLSASNENVMPSPKGSAILSVGSEDDAHSVQARTAAPMDAAPAREEDSDSKLEQDPFETLEILKSGIAPETCD